MLDGNCAIPLSLSGDVDAGAAFLSTKLGEIVDVTLPAAWVTKASEKTPVGVGLVAAGAATLANGLEERLPSFESLMAAAFFPVVERAGTSGDVNLVVLAVGLPDSLLEAARFRFTGTAVDFLAGPVVPTGGGGCVDWPAVFKSFAPFSLPFTIL